MSTILQPSEARAARIRVLQAEIWAREAELLGLLEDDELSAAASVEAEIEAIADAPAGTPRKPARKRRHRRRSAQRAPGTSEQDIAGTREAARRAGMLVR
jgi:hypothetical protein